MNKLLAILNNIRVLQVIVLLNLVFSFGATWNAEQRYADDSHTHREYADDSHSHYEYAGYSHTHREYADDSHSHYDSLHTHHEYADYSHKHYDAHHTHHEYASQPSFCVRGNCNFMPHGH